MGIYPLHLVPTKNLKTISQNELNISNYLGKWVDNAIELKDVDGKLNASAIDINRIPGFSTNKIPGSTIIDLNIEFDKQFSHLYIKSWHEGDIGIMPEDNHFQFNQERKHYFLRIADMQFTDEYLNPPDKTDIVYKYTVNVEHKPLVSNYWHFELTVTSPDHIINNSSGAWRKLICSGIRDRIQEKAVFEL